MPAVGRASTRSPDRPSLRRTACSRPPGSSDEAEPVLAGIGIFPAEQPLAGRGRSGGPEHRRTGCLSRERVRGNASSDWPSNLSTVRSRPLIECASCDGATRLARRPGVGRQAGSIGPDQDAAVAVGDQVRVVCPQSDHARRAGVLISLVSHRGSLSAERPGPQAAGPIWPQILGGASPRALPRPRRAGFRAGRSKIGPRRGRGNRQTRRAALR